MLRSRAFKLIITFISVFLLLVFISKYQILDLVLYSGSFKTWKLPNISRDIVFSSNGEMLAIVSGSLNRIVKIKRVLDSKIIQILRFSFPVRSLAFSPDNDLITIGSYREGKIKIISINDGQLIDSFSTNNHTYSSVNFLAFTKDGKTLVTEATGNPGEITVWNFNDSQKRYTIPSYNRSIFKCTGISSDGKFLAFNDAKKTLTLYRLSDGNPLWQINSGCHDLKFSSDGKIIAVLHRGSKESVNIFSTQNDQKLQSISLEKFTDKELPKNIDISPDNRYVAISFTVLHESDIFIPSLSYARTSHGRIRIWNIENGKLVATLRGHRKGTDKIAFSPDGKLLSSTGKDNTIKFWHMPPYSRLWL